MRSFKSQAKNSPDKRGDHYNSQPLLRDSPNVERRFASNTVNEFNKSRAIGHHQSATTPSSPQRVVENESRFAPK